MKTVQFTATGKPREVKARLATACRAEARDLPPVLVTEIKRLKGEIVPGDETDSIVVFADLEDTQDFVRTCRFCGYVSLSRGRVAHVFQGLRGWAR